MAKLKPYYSRSFLNKKEGVAAIECTAKFDNPLSVAGKVKITDCNHTVNLDFDFWSVEEKDKKQYKLDKLINELQAFRAALLPAIKE